jgi:hypothetical protein
MTDAMTTDPITEALEAAARPLSEMVFTNPRDSDFIARAVVLAFLKKLRDPTPHMWECAENASMMAECEYEACKSPDDPIHKDAHSFPTARIWQGVVMYRAMVEALISSIEDRGEG